MRMEEFANKKSPVYTNVAYDDHQTQREITRRVHEQMVQTGSVVQIPDDASEAIREYYPDLRRMKKTERTPILKQKMGELKTALRKILDGLKGTTYQFEINGNILDAKLYDTGIREVLEKITQNKAEMLTQSDAIFRNAQYLYSTPDYEGNSNIYRWNYFYSPVQIGTETVGVRIAVRDTMRPAESQIYNWNIKKAALDGEGRLPDGRSSSGVSSAADGTTDTAVAPSIAQPQTEVNPTADAENDGRLRLPTLEDEPAQPSAERAAEANTAPVEPMAVTQARDILDEFEGTVQLTESQQRMVNAARETVQEWENSFGQTERTEQNDGTEQTAAAAEAGADPAVRGQERESAENDALADRAVAGGGQPRAAAQSQSKTAARRSLKAEQLRLKPVSTKSLGLENGTDRARVTVYPREAWDAELTQAAKALEDKGYEVQFVLGALEFAKPAMLTDGCVVGDKVIVRANSMRHTATELCEHERFHTLMNENPGASAMIWEKVDAELRDSRYDRLVEQYVQAYLEAYEGDEARIQEELMADAYAGLNRFGEMPEVQRMVRELAQQFESGEAADLLQGQVEPGVRSSQTAREQNRTRDGTKFSIETIGGEPITVIDTQNDTREFAAAERYLKTLVDAEHPFSTILSDAQPVYLGKDLPGEYRGSEYTKTMLPRLRTVKMQAATNLDEMLLLAENGEWRENVKPKHARDAKNGWYRYETQFAVPVLNIKKAIDHYTVYDGTLLIRNDADGKSYLYDLLDIEKKKVISAASFSAKPHSEVLPPKPSSENIIRSGGQNVKWENSGQEKYTAESGLEGKTAFMAAYEAARTEKANRQNEPQYSLTQATEERKMSSRARRDVNQTMNAVRIAGDKKPESALRSLVRGTPEGTRTPNPQNRNLMLYPLSHWRVCLYIITHDAEKSSGGREKLRGGKPVPVQREMAAATGKNPRPQTFENQAQRAAAGRA